MRTDMNSSRTESRIDIHSYFSAGSLVIRTVLLYYYRMKRAAIHEVFASIQGEGLWIGERHIFVRFFGCDLRCRYCDTPAAVKIGPDSMSGNGCRAQKNAGAFDSVPVENPVSVPELTALCGRLSIPGPSRPVLSITGGEPLLHREFLSEWLPAMRSTFRVYLETNGIHSEAMHFLKDHVDVVSMDFKLPSATGLRPFWEEHRRFLSAARGKKLFVKAVVTSDTVKDDILIAAGIIEQFDKAVSLVLQPAAGSLAPEPMMLITYQNLALGILEDVRVIPQAHKMLNLP